MLLHRRVPGVLPQQQPAAMRLERAQIGVRAIVQRREHADLVEPRFVEPERGVERGGVLVGLGQRPLAPAATQITPSRYRSASSAAWQPLAALVTAWR